MSFWLGVIIFALGILVSVCLHEAGHLISAKKFGMKATQYFAGFGPTLWSFRRGETEYGLKAIPAGGFVKIVGMTPLEQVPEEDAPRAFWRYPLWQRTVVLVAGSATHFLLAVVVFFIAALTTGLPNPARADWDPLAGPPVVGEVAECVVPQYQLAKDGGLRACRPGDPAGPAQAAGLRAGDRIVSVAGRPMRTYGDLLTTVRGLPAGPTEVVYVRNGQRRTATVDLVTTYRPPLDKPKAQPQPVSAIGVAAQAPPSPILHYNALTAAPASVWYLGESIRMTFDALVAFPSKIPNLVDAIGGAERDRAGPISVVGASRVGGEAVELGLPIVFLAMLGGLNVFVGIFNLLPLLPLDGGHVAVAWYERARSWLAARRGRPDPGRVDYNKLMPLTYAVVILFGGLTLLTLTADIVNPIRL